ncbi:PREDICTED: plexin domain-containing protein 2-like [Branchiostoma belcheri]|uniref:Plexin domain-containing protein 2-like n=1 Tax=Branchiostoma belcheri TaxID=7741 RepID=A0A6P4Z1B0_BRABE|nr:PREDICTED: plexin domain-containing protein 2-like [Branchiostoma belcheri]
MALQKHIPKTTALSPVRPGVRVRRNGGESAPLRQTQGTGNNYNRTALDENYHEYYRSHYYTHYPPGRGFWVDVDGERNGHTIANGLPGRNMNTKNVRLSFDFPFYGSPIRNITIAVKGFMSIGSALSHSLASTQYIAPLMANFDPGLDPMSVVRYRDNGSALSVEWGRLRLRDDTEGQTFTFQVTLSRDGRIIFVYKKIPKPVTSIDDSSHPVRVGISDAYTVEALLVPFSDINRKTSTIYEYHTIELEKGRVATGSAIVLSPLPTCGQFGDCNSCLRSKTGFNCRWCPSLNRCSDGYDRSRQQWVDAGCDKQAGYVRCRTGNVPLLEVPSTSVTTRAKPTRPSLVFRRFPTTAESRFTNVRDDKSINFPETTSNSRQRINVWQVTNDDPGVGTDHRVPDTLDNRDQERTSYGIPQTLEIEVVICILVAVVIVVVAIAWIIHSYSRRPGLELFVVEIDNPDNVRTSTQYYMDVIALYSKQ